MARKAIVLLTERCQQSCGSKLSDDPHLHSFLTISSCVSQGDVEASLFLFTDGITEQSSSSTAGIFKLWSACDIGRSSWVYK